MQKKKMVAEDEMVRYHQQLSGHEFEQTLRDSIGQEESGLLQSMGSQRVAYNVLIEQQQLTRVNTN